MAILSTTTRTYLEKALYLFPVKVIALMGLVTLGDLTNTNRIVAAVEQGGTSSLPAKSAVSMLPTGHQITFPSARHTSTRYRVSYVIPSKASIFVRITLLHVLYSVCVGLLVMRSLSIVDYLVKCSPILRITLAAHPCVMICGGGLIIPMTILMAAGGRMGSPVKSIWAFR